MQSPGRESFGTRTACAHCGAPFTPHVTGETLCDRCHGLAQPEPTSPLQQTEIAGYRLSHELGAGRYSHSWLAQDGQTTKVVLKLLRRYAPDPDSVQGFLAEAERVAAIADFSHPNLARPITAGVHLVSAFFLVYQFGGEHTLADELRSRGRLLPARALELCAQLCEGLGVLHRAGLLHLDLKPANVGIAKLPDGTEEAVLLDLATRHLLATAGIAGDDPLPLSSAAFLSPEEAAGEPTDPRSDLYAVGVLLFQLISGRLPLTGSSSEELTLAHRHQKPLRLRDAGRRVHDDLELLLARLLAKDPGQRPHSADEASVLMRATIPLAEAAPAKDADEWFDDPLPVAEVPPLHSEVAPPPQMLPPAVDPALERAMMGEVPAQPPEQRPGVPRWAAFVPPRWWPAPVALAAIALVSVAFWQRARPAPSPSVAIASPVAEAAHPPPPETVLRAALDDALRRDPPQDPALLGQETPRPPAPQQPPPQTAKVKSAYAKSFDRAQKALWTGQAALAQSVLRDLLRKRLTRSDRARASRMMGDSESKKGHRPAAARWYRRALGLSDDPDDRARIAKLLNR